MEHFDGDDYQPERDHGRLTTQLTEILEAVSDRAWHTLAGLEEVTGHPPASISAQLRNLRKPRFGGHIVERRYVGDGLYEYRLGEAA